MATLQKVNLGTPPTAVDGDTSRGANTKANANVDVLNAQATLSSAAATITSAQALTAAHVGKRVNINLAAAGTINLPSAATMGLDGVVHLRNLGTTLVTLAIATGSGDTVALTKLYGGESAVLDSDGTHAIGCLLRARSNSDNETVIGNSVVNGNETIGGSLVINAATAQTVFQLGNAVTRWIYGSDSSNLFINRYNSSGTFLDAPFALSLSTGALALANALTAGGLITASGSLTSSTFAEVSSGAYRAQLRNDGSNVYLLSSASGGAVGSFNSLRPFAWNLSDGSVTIGTAGGPLTRVMSNAIFGQTAISTAQALGGSAYQGTTITYQGAIYNQANTDTNIYLSKATGGSGTTFMQFLYNGNSTGSIAFTGNTTCAYYTSSDYRLKTTLGPITDALARVCAVPTYRGYFTADGANAEQDLALAHEIAAHFPLAVGGAKDAVEYHPVYRDGYDPENVSADDIVDVVESMVVQQVDYSKLVVPLMAATRELKSMLDSALARIEALEAKKVA